MQQISGLSSNRSMRLCDSQEEPQERAGFSALPKLGAVIIEFPEKNAQVVERDVEKQSVDNNELSLQAERKLILEWQKSHDPKILNHIILGMSKFLTGMAARYARGIPHIARDLYHEGVLVIIQALPNYRPQGETRFVSLVWKGVRAAMSKARHRAASVLKVPQSAAILASRGEMSDREEALVRAAYQGLSLEAMGSGDLLDPSQDAAKLLEQEQKKSRIGAMLARAMRDLDPLEMAMIERRLDGEMTDISLVAREMGVSRGRAIAADGMALRKMRRVLLRDGFSKKEEEWLI